MYSLDAAGLVFTTIILAPLAYMAVTEGIPVVRDVFRDARDFIVPERKQESLRGGAFAKA